jgi:hypothetical protein
LVNVDCNSEPDLVPSCEGTHILEHWSRSNSFNTFRLLGEPVIGHKF